MSLDDALIEIGELGLYQVRSIGLLLLPSLSTVPFMVLSVFVLAVPEHRCRIPGFYNDSYHVMNDHHRDVISKYIPNDTEHRYDRCHLLSGSNNSTLTKCSSWVYSQELFDSTFTSQVNLVCDDTYKTSLAKTIFFAGVFVGSFGFGVLSDFIGRKKTLFLAILCLVASSLGTMIASSYAVFVLFRFCVGVCTVGVFMTSFVTSMEWVGPNKRSVAGLVIACFGPFGSLYLAMMAYFLRDWRYIDLAMAIPTGLTLFLWWFIPESPRWLVTTGKLEEARALLERAASVNGTTLRMSKSDLVISTDNKQTGRIWLLLSSKTLLTRSCIIFFNWMVVSMMFYGLSLNAGGLYGNFYLNFVFLVLVEFPGHIIPLFVIDRIGRKKTHCLFMMLGGIACLSTIFTVTFGGKEIQNVTTALAMLGKCGATAAFSTIYVFSAEQFPTVVRNVGMGTSSCFARIGGMASPFIADLAGLVGGHSGKAIPLVIFGGASVLAGLLTFLLPETLGTTLPETIDDSKTIGKSMKKENQNNDEIFTTNL